MEAHIYAGSADHFDREQIKLAAKEIPPDPEMLKFWEEIKDDPTIKGAIRVRGKLLPSRR